MSGRHRNRHRPDQVTLYQVFREAGLDLSKSDRKKVQEYAVERARARARQDAIMRHKLPPQTYQGG